MTFASDTTMLFTMKVIVDLSVLHFAADSSQLMEVGESMLCQHKDANAFLASYQCNVNSIKFECLFSAKTFGRDFFLYC
jgi:hypothetical protein